MYAFGIVGLSRATGGPPARCRRCRELGAARAHAARGGRDRIAHGGVQPKGTATVALRPVTTDDRELLLQIFASTRLRELALLGDEDELRSRFLVQQFGAQETHLRSVHPTASRDVVLVDGVSAGRLYVDRRAHEIEILEIALLPAARGRGVGTKLLEGLLKEAGASGKKLTLQVQATSRARALYERLGFRRADQGGVYLRMEHDGVSG
jgi:ribosomal protein S18 acetylase RimI-like enzyme